MQCQGGLSSRKGTMALSRFASGVQRTVPQIARLLTRHCAAAERPASRSFRVLAAKEVPRSVGSKAAAVEGVKSISSAAAPRPYSDLTVGEQAGAVKGGRTH